MAMDVAVELISATVQLEAPYGDGTRNVGTGFLVDAPGPDGHPRIVLITAGHVLERMPGEVMTIGYRAVNRDGQWKYRPQSVVIRDEAKPLWVTVDGRDIAAIEVQPNPDIVEAAIPAAWLADEAAFTAEGIGPGDEMMALGYPWGMSANTAGFPILRAGKVASYPIAPTREFPTFLLDFSVFPGNSGGPVFVRHGEGDAQRLLVTGVMTQQLETNNQRLEIGVVTQAGFIRDAISELNDGAGLHVARAVTNSLQAAAPQSGVVAAASSAR